MEQKPEHCKEEEITVDEKMELIGTAQAVMLYELKGVKKKFRHLEYKCAGICSFTIIVCFVLLKCM